MLKKSFKIDNNIYDNNIIIQSINDFKEIADISFVNGELIIQSKDDINEIFNEFMNYVIGLQNELV